MRSRNPQIQKVGQLVCGVCVCIVGCCYVVYLVAVLTESELRSKRRWFQLVLTVVLSLAEVRCGTLTICIAACCYYLLLAQVPTECTHVCTEVVGSNYAHCIWHLPPLVPDPFTRCDCTIPVGCITDCTGCRTVVDATRLATVSPKGSCRQVWTSHFQLYTVQRENLVDIICGEMPDFNIWQVLYLADCLCYGAIVGFNWLMVSFEIDSCIRDYHAYGVIWTPTFDEHISYKQEIANTEDLCAQWQ